MQYVMVESRLSDPIKVGPQGVPALSSSTMTVQQPGRRVRVSCMRMMTLTLFGIGTLKISKLKSGKKQIFLLSGSMTIGWSAVVPRQSYLLFAPKNSGEMGYFFIQSMTLEDSHRIQIIMNKVLRSLTNLDQDTHTWYLLKTSGFLSFHQMCAHSTLKTAHKILIPKEPEYLYKKLMNSTSSNDRPRLGAWRQIPGCS